MIAPIDPDGPGAIFHVTCRVNWQVWHLAESDAKLVVLRLLARALDEYGVALLAWVLMSNHCHFVLQSPGPDEYRRLTGRRTSCRHFRPWPPGHAKSTVRAQFMRRLLRSVAVELQEDMEITGHFWEGPHHKRVLADPDELVIAMAYDHRNPVREGMAPRAEDYAWSLAAWWAGAKDDRVPMIQECRLPWDLERDELGARLARCQADRRVDDIMDAMRKRRLRPDSTRGRRYFRRLLADAGLLR